MRTIAFFSYARNDDHAVNGLLTKIRVRLEVEVRVRIGDEDLEVFQDTDDIAVGENWENRLRQAIDSAAVFIPVITPFYFTRSGCRKEFEIWLSNYRTIDERERIIPIKFLPLTAKKGNGSPNDRLRVEIEKIQYLDMQKYHSNMRISGGLKAAITKLAENILTFY